MTIYKTICSVYKSSKKSEMYLYVNKKTGVKELPDALRQIFGTPVHVMDMLLTPERSLGRTEAAKVLADIQEKGFYLQLPPADENNLLEAFRISQGLDPHVGKNHGR
jgi:uncharacterized protein YcgL (UPF0745 family)